MIDTSLQKRTECLCWLCILLLTLLVHPATALQSPFQSPQQKQSTSSKAIFLNSLDTLTNLNAATKEQTQLVQNLIADNPTPQPGSVQSFRPLAAGTWSVVYAPHIYTISKLAGGKIDPVLYDLRQDGTMTSHAKFNLPWVHKSGWLSVSGTYSSQDDNRICRVDFDKTWMKWNDQNDKDDQPCPTLEDVPSSWETSLIQTMGSWLFIDSFSVFPVSYLDQDLIVFDFELLGTRICARKIKK